MSVSRKQPGAPLFAGAHGPCRRHGWPAAWGAGLLALALGGAACGLAGTSRMRHRRFAIANAASAIVWAGIVTFVSYVAGNTLRRTSGAITWVLVGLAVVMAAVLLLARRRAEELADRAEAAYPVGS